MNQTMGQLIRLLAKALKRKGHTFDGMIVDRVEYRFQDPDQLIDSPDAVEGFGTVYRFGDPGAPGDPVDDPRALPWTDDKD